MAKPITLKIALRHFNKDIHQWYGWKDLDAGEVYSNIKLKGRLIIYILLDVYQWV